MYLRGDHVWQAGDDPDDVIYRRIMPFVKPGLNEKYRRMWSGFRFTRPTTSQRQ
jgi:hypothetical protein